MSLLFRLAVYLPVLCLIAVVVVGKQHTTARDALRAAAARTVRWALPPPGRGAGHGDDMGGVWPCQVPT